MNNFSMEDFQILCPLSHCGGWVIYIDDGDEKFFGCGECGNVWFNKAVLDNDIMQIIQRYPHRKNFYLKKSDGYYPIENPDLDEIDKLLETETWYYDL